MILKLKGFILGLVKIVPLIWLLFYLVMSINSRSGFNHEWHAIGIVIIIYLIHALLFNQKFKRLLGLAE